MTLCGNFYWAVCSWSRGLSFSYPVQSFNFGYLSLVWLQIAFRPSRVSVSRSQWLRGLRWGSAVACWFGGFESRPGEWMSLNAVCCQTEVSATGRPLVHSSPTEKWCVWVLSVMRNPWPSGSLCTVEGKRFFCRTENMGCKVAICFK
jgi:hypothetical protein